MTASSTLKVRGRVVRKMFAKGSKSEREAVFLETGNGDYLLRRMDGDPYHDPKLDKLVGSDVICTGMLKDYLLILTEEPRPIGD